MKYTISARESEVLHLIAYEYTSNEIADYLYISHYTAKDHRNSLLKKLDVRNSAGLVRRAFELGLMKKSSSLPDNCRYKTNSYKRNLSIL